ncbi:MAG: ABC transporter [Hyphomicrobium sp. 32-62-53]|nr:MAG: ABC transporter [Hyphomicrobium sp. 12-62-95]OYX97445.1 MAG: ABC transporter [Hyphomicrobium sp. 32-62-53]
MTASILPLIKRLVAENGRQYAPLYAVAIVAMVVVAGATAASAYLMKHVINSIFVNQDRTALYALTLGIFVIFTIKGFGSYFSEVLLGRIGNRLVAQTQRRLFEHLLKVDVSFFQARSSSQLVMQISQNATSVKEMLTTVSLTFGRDLFTVIALVGTMIFLDPIMTAIALIGGPLVVLISRKLVTQIRAAATGEIHSLAGIINATRELSQGVHVVKSFQLEPHMNERMDNAVSAVERLSNKMLRVQAVVNPLMDSLGGFAVAAVVFYAGWRNLNYGDTPGQFFAFITALLMAAEPARRISQAHLKLAASAIGVKMMYDLLDTPAREAETIEKPPLRVSKGDIVLENVVFGYTPDKPVIKGLNLIAPAQKVTALVGLSGGGKSTLLGLLQRFHEPQSGRILIDGQPIRDHSIASLRRNITYVGQDVFLFEGTILDNIRAGCRDATDEQCIEAAKAAGAHPFISQQSKGYQTEVGELGSQVSGGQRQRISIARAFVKNTPIILLDEPTSALDSETEDHIQRELQALTEKRTTVVIAHRLSTILHADVIHVIEDGQVVESGSHADLLKKGGPYSRLFLLQFARVLNPDASTAVN